MAFSYSFHLSAKSNAVNSVGKVVQVEKHNLRKYKSEKYDRSQIVTIRGTDSLLDDVKKVYHEEFDECLERYNQGKREDRKVKNYLEHVSNSRSDVAAEIIIQVGDKDFWKDIPKEDQKAMTAIFTDQIKTLEQILPGFKIANATIHYDESSPHMHVVGVPVADGYVKGMEKQVAKTKVFTKESLTKCQDVLRKRAEIGINSNYRLFGDVQLKEKEKGRNRDIPKYAMDSWTEIQAEIKDAQEVLKNTKDEIELLEVKEKEQQDRIDKYGIRADSIDTIGKEVSAAVKKAKAAATPGKSLFGGEEYVKVKRSEWDSIITTFEKAVQKTSFLDRYEEKIAELEKTVDYLNTRMEKFTNRIKEMKKFLTEKNMLHEFLNLTRKPEQETIQERIDRKNAEAKAKAEQADRGAGRRKKQRDTCI